MENAGHGLRQQKNARGNVKKKNMANNWREIESVMDAKTEAWIKVEARQCKLFARCPALDVKGQNVGYFSWVPWHLKHPEIPAPS